MIAGISISGLPIEEFTFIGFLSSKKAQRQKILKEVSIEKRTLIFYEAPHRIIETLFDIEEIFGNRKAAVIKEITKLYEEALRGSLKDIIHMLDDRTIAGEYIIVIEGKKKEDVSFDDALDEVKLLMKKGKGRKEAVTMVAGQYGLSKKELYEKSLFMGG